MDYASINIQGNIVSSEVLDKIRKEEEKFQTPGHFKLDVKTSVRDEIGLAWGAARAHWTAFSMRRDRLQEGESGVSETRNSWMIPLLRELGYNVEKANAFIHPDTGKSYAISHRAENLGGFPIHIMGIGDKLDERRETGGPRLSPHGLGQEYLNHTEHTYALVSNGAYLRLLRDSTRLVRLSYLEFNLEKMMVEELYSDFALLFRLLHATRMPVAPDALEESPIEYYHLESLASGSRIREKLSVAVEVSIKELANGILRHPANADFHQAVVEGDVKAEDYYLHLLRLIYRLLFLIVTEERKLVYPDTQELAVQRLRKVYYEHYSIERLRKLAASLRFVDGRKWDLWEGLMATFRLFENGFYGKKLGIQPLGSGLFSEAALGDIPGQKMDNESLLKVIRNLTFFENEQKQFVRVNYSDLDVEEFGSVYEGLLEYDATFVDVNGRMEFAFKKGTGRSSSGSHYTPEELVRPLIKHSLDYLIADKLRYAGLMANSEWRMAGGALALSEGELRILNGEWNRIAILVSNFIINIYHRHGAELPRTGGLEAGNDDRGGDLQIDKLISKGGIVWDDFSTPKVVGLDSSKHRGRLGTQYEEGIRLLSTDLVGEPDGDRNTSDIGLESGTLQKGTGGSDSRGKQNSEQTTSKFPALHFAERHLKQAWSALPFAIRHSLIAETGLLSLRVADVACGSGHILLSAARRIGFELACLRETRAAGGKVKVEQPSPTYNRAAIRDVIRHCIYGVDKNPLAVELCKVALWLEAHNPGEPLNFLDHHIKCGDAIVGLAHREELMRGIATEAFKALPGDDKEVASGLAKRNKTERGTRGQNVLDFEGKLKDGLDAALTAYKDFDALPERTPEEIAAKAVAYDKLRKQGALNRLKDVADLQVAQFFIPKTAAKKDKLVTDAAYFRILEGRESMEPLVAAEVMVESMRRRFFHWFLEFPEVFGAGGFDCILGNPPFLGGQKLSGTYGDQFLECIKYEFAPIGAVDLVTYFFRRIFSIIRNGGFQSLISTNTIAQGSSREGGLDVIVGNGGSINHAVKSMRWPGKAAVEVALVTITKQEWNLGYFLAGKRVETITPYLDDSELAINPVSLVQNQNKSFQGCIVLGKGFLMEPIEAQRLISKNSENRKVLFPYLNGEDLNNIPDQIPSRWAINFFDWPESQALKYPECYEIVSRSVKPERIKMVGDRGAEYWWQYLRGRKELYNTIAGLSRVLVHTRVTKTHAFNYVETSTVFSDATIVFCVPFFSVLQSNLHEHWSWTYSSSMKGDRRYAPSDCFETFPFPQNFGGNRASELDDIGETYHEHRRQLMLGMQLGLTKTYNLFHARALRVVSAAEASLDDKAFEKLLGKEALSLRKHLAKTPEATLSFTEAVTGILELRRLHVEMDTAVASAYGWEDIALRHDFYEVDYLPENDRVRYTIHPDARREVLKRLLALNHAIHAEEVAAGLWDKKSGAGGAAAKKKKGGGDSGQLGLFGDAEVSEDAPEVVAPKRGRKRKVTSPEEMKRMLEEIKGLRFGEDEDSE
jgi:hypothetical protein